MRQHKGRRTGGAKGRPFRSGILKVCLSAGGLAAEGQERCEGTDAKSFCLFKAESALNAAKAYSFKEHMGIFEKIWHQLQF